MIGFVSPPEGFTMVRETEILGLLLLYIYESTNKFENKLLTLLSLEFNLISH